MSFSLTFNTKTDAGMASLDAFLQSRSYAIGFAPTQADAQLFAALGSSPDAAKYPNVFRYYKHINSFSADARARFADAAGFAVGTAAAGAGAAAPAKGKGKGKPAPVDDSSDDDMFASSDDEGGKAKAKKKAAAAKAKAKAAAAANKKKSAKPAKVESTQCVYDVKTLEAGQDMKALETAIRNIEIDGLTWGAEFKVEDVAFGIQKLIVQAVIINEKVSTQDIEEALEALEDQVQSVDLRTMNRL